MNYEWVIGRYDVSTKNGAFVLSSANAGGGYILLNKPSGRGGEVIVAFKRPLDRPRPHHLDPASDEQVARFEEIVAKRGGIAH